MYKDENPLTIPYSGYARIRGNLWGWEPVLSTSPLIVDSIDDEKRAELQEIAKDEYSSLIKSNMLSSQFRILYYLEVKKEEVKENILFASPLDITAIEKFPVILASYLERQEGEVTFSTDRIYPMARYGAGALVSFAEDKIGLYNISDLPQEAQDRQKLIDQTLDSLEANMENVDTSTSLFDKNAEVQAMIQQLAQDYYEFHLIQMQNRKRVKPVTTNPFAGGYTQMPSPLPFQAVFEGIQDAASGARKWAGKEGQAPYFKTEDRKSKRTTIMEYRDENDEILYDKKTAASLWEQVEQLSDKDNDLLITIFAHFTKAKDADSAIWIFASDHLKYRGLIPMLKDAKGRHTEIKGITVEDKRTAGHRPEDIDDVGRSIRRLQKIWLIIDQIISDEEIDKKTKKHKKRQFTHRGRLLTIEETWHQKELITDNEYDPGTEIAWKVKPGAWLRTFLEYPNTQVAVVSQAVLQFNPRKELWEKRLGFYFMVHGHMANPRGGGATFGREIGDLLHKVSLSPENADTKRVYPQEIKDRFEKALNQLVKHEIIAEWKYAEEFKLPAKRWLAEWLKQKVIIHIAPPKPRLQ